MVILVYLGLHFDAVLHGKAVLKLSHLCRKNLDFHFKNVTPRTAVTSDTWELLSNQKKRKTYCNASTGPDFIFRTTITRNFIKLSTDNIKSAAHQIRSSVMKNITHS